MAARKLPKGHAILGHLQQYIIASPRIDDARKVMRAVDVSQEWSLAKKLPASLPGDIALGVRSLEHEMLSLCLLRTTVFAYRPCSDLLFFFNQCFCVGARRPSKAAFTSSTASTHISCDDRRLSHHNTLVAHIRV